ncbi:MAG: hypothetical protein ACRDR6_03420 [Pseudonocardiaceae bacterium]
MLLPGRGFFAGRGLLDYEDFLNGAGQYGSKAIFLGDDDVSRYVADSSERNEAQTSPFWYLSFASAREIPKIHTANKLIEGATGTIDFGGDITHNVPRDKQVAILQVTNGEVDPSTVETCGAITGHTQPTWCPH